MWRGAGIALALALLSGCDTVGAARMAYPDRALLSFDSEVQEGRFGYACTHTVFQFVSDRGRRGCADGNQLISHCLCRIINVFNTTNPS